MKREVTAAEKQKGRILPFASNLTAVHRWLWTRKNCAKMLVKITKTTDENDKNRCEMYKLVKWDAFHGNAPLTNVRLGSIILVLFLTEQ